MKNLLFMLGFVYLNVFIIGFWFIFLDLLSILRLILVWFRVVGILLKFEGIINDLGKLYLVVLNSLYGLFWFEFCVYLIV